VQSDYDFVDDPDRYFQLVITDRLVNCVLSSIERQNLLHYKISSKYMIEHFGSHTFKINAQLLSGAYPIISELYGPTQELELEFKVKKPTVSFGIADNDVGFEFEFDFGIKLAGDMNFLIYDELKFRFEGDLVFDQEVLFGELSTVILEQTGQNKGQRTLPVFNSLSMAEDNY
jgi:hypothetical protein